MLTDFDKVILKSKMIPQEDIDNMTSYDHRTGVATFADGSQRTTCETYTRIMGYFRNVDAFNIGKKGEYKERLWFTEDNVNRCPCSKAA